MNPDAEVPTLTETWYPTLYTAACLLAFVAVLIALPGYLKHPFRVSPMAIGVGVVGIFVWLGLWWLDKETLQIGHWMGGNSRAAFNPFVELGEPTPAWWMYTFIGIRLLGLCIVIPIAEEFFARGFLMRYIEDIDWDQIPLGEATWKGLAGIIAYGAMTHPGEIVAAVAWFGLITWMYLKTKNIWDCVVAHSVTNALLAVFVIVTGTWELW
jgi:CAAX prenyl protease-like protein